MTATRRSWLLALTVGLAAGPACSKKDAPVGPPGLRDTSGNLVNGEPAPAPAKPAASPASGQVAFDDSLNGPRPGERGTYALPGAAASNGALGAGGAEQTSDGAAPERDLRAEVSALLDPRGACVDLSAAAANGGRLVLSATVSLLPGGGIMRATVNAPGQPPDVRTCLEQRLLTSQLPGPIPGAPRNVDASVIVEVAQGRPAAAANPPSPPVLRPGSQPPPPAADLARPDPGEIAKPDPGDVAGPP